MKNPFGAFKKASQLSRKGRPLAAIVTLQRALHSVSKPKPKRKHAVASPRQSKPKPIGAGTSLARPPRQAPGSFISGRHDNAYGAIAYRLYTPTGPENRRLPLVVMLHGCTQSATDFATGTGMNALADELGFLVLYPEQSTAVNLNRCWNWHRPDNQRRGSGEPAAIAALTQHVIRACRANRARTYIAGISAGGTIAAIIAAAYPDIYAAVGIHSAVASGKVRTLHGALLAMKKGGSPAIRSRAARALPTIIFHGDCDNVVHVSNANAFVGAFAGSTTRPIIGQLRHGRSDGGRDFTCTLYAPTADQAACENWTVHGSGHAWSGGKRAGSNTDPTGPDASREIIRFFMAQRLPPEAEVLLGQSKVKVAVKGGRCRKN